ncbi:WD40/YVTN/BNR-like repeat-containing protein [Actinocrispum wychmicini]|uniref:BNR/Asp-box repeat protein n=1 Tax=Actinocrispum wychmicini TaxID=1213861 RepID=A0A4R2K0R3_9PSEU|nr:hypothetical protein [Actinocrispum wychmicini]TCO65222.1 hypothetical protein EV192_1011010 [Actinocrispum wychmicini]
MLAALAGLLVFSTPSYAGQAGFLPSSTSWLTASRGAVFGYTPCGGDLCPALLGTVDGGATWHALTPPPVKLPDNHNQVQLTVIDRRTSFVSDGTSLWATNDSARSWYQISLSALRTPFFISKVAISHGKVFAVAQSLGNGEEDFTQIYSAPVGATILRPLAGFVAKGGINYGDIAVDGNVIQLYLGADFASEQYGYSVDGIHFRVAPSPCPVANFARLGGIRDGRPMVLCNGGGGSPAPGHMTRQVWTAPQLGGTFEASAPAPDVGITQGFGPASPQNITIAAVGGGIGILHNSFDGGQTWKSLTLSERGFGLFDLRFVTDKVGFVVDGTPDSADGSAVFRSVDAGHTWQEMKINATRWATTGQGGGPPGAEAL